MAFNGLARTVELPSWSQPSASLPTVRREPAANSLAGLAFCAGADINLLQDIAAKERVERATDDKLAAANPGDPAVGEGYRQTYSYFASIRKPIIAAINAPRSSSCSRSKRVSRGPSCSNSPLQWKTRTSA